MDAGEARRRFVEARFARLATVRPDGAPHLVPVVFAADGDRLFTAVDEKPKRSRALARLANVEHEPRVSLLVDHEDEDWGGLWWVRADGEAHVLHDGPEAERARRLLAERYDAYRSAPPSGPVIAVDVRVWQGWTASGEA